MMTREMTLTLMAVSGKDVQVKHPATFALPNATTQKGTVICNQSSGQTGFVTQLPENALSHYTR